MIDYEADPRAFSECLKDFALRLNNGETYGARPITANALRTPETTLAGWMKGRPCRHEPAMRRLMTLIIQTPARALPSS